MSLLPSFDDDLSAPSTPSTPSQTKHSIVGGVLAHASPPIDWLKLTLKDLTPHSHGLCSSVYRRSLSPAAVFPYDPSAASCSTSSPSSTVSSALAAVGGIEGWLCIKRVMPDAQPRPHSVSREVALLDRLEHRNIAPLLAAVLDTSDPFGAVVDLVMPLYCATLEEVLQEPSLARLAEVEGGVRAGNSIVHLWKDSTTRFTHSVAQQLLSGVAFLHERNVAHRDIKPSNVLLSFNGAVKIIDLGTAYTTTPLTDPLGSSPQGEAESEVKMVHQVGTGQFRAPELLFSPIHGYDPFAIDVWSVAVCLSLFFTPLTPIPRSNTSQDERQDWQRAFESSTPLPASDSDDGFWEEDPLPASDAAAENASGYTRTPLFTADRGDIGLAASIFALLGLPRTTQDWPEADFFQPPLDRLPFTATDGKGLLSALPLYDPAQAATLVEKIILPSLHLSACKRPNARALLAALESGHPSS